MATTTNYSWSTPDDTALVKDGAAAIRSLGTAIDSTVFTNAGNAIAKSIVDAKGDLIAATADKTVARLASSGVNDQVLTIDTSTSTGLKWAAPAAGGMTLLTSGNASIASSTLVLSSISGAYNDLVFVASDFHPDTNQRTISFTANAVADYDYAIQTLLSGTSIQDFGGIAAATIDPQYNSMSNANDQNALIIRIFDYANTTSYKLVNITHHFVDRLSQTNSLFAWGSINTTSAIDSITINMNANFGTAGAYKLYGVK